MFRLRRYRVFLVFTVVVIGTLYYLAATSDLDSPGASVEGLRKFGLKESPKIPDPSRPPGPPTVDNHFHDDSKLPSTSWPAIPGTTPNPEYHPPSVEEQPSSTTQTVAVKQENNQKPSETDEDSIVLEPGKSAELDGITGDLLNVVKSEKSPAPTISPELDEVSGHSKNFKAENSAAATTSSKLNRVSGDYLRDANPKAAATTTSPTVGVMNGGTYDDLNIDLSATGTAKPALDNTPEPYGVGRFDGVSDVKTSTIHWKRLPEHFPVPSQSIMPLPSGKPKAIPKIQHVFSDESASDKIDRLQKLNAIKAAFLASWNGYKEKAWMQDELSPVSGLARNPFCGWAATLVDSLDTLWIMGLKEEFEEATNAVKEIDFTTSNRQELPLFEIVIRYLGGLIAAYDLSAGTYRVLLDKAVELAEVLMGAFDTPNRMPLTFYPWKPAFSSQPHRARTRVVLAELGSLSVEFTRLAQLTRESKYYDAIARITNEFEAWQNNTKLPGLWPTSVDASGCRKHDMSLVSQKNHSLLNGPASETLNTPKEPFSNSGKFTPDHFRQSSEEEGELLKTSSKDLPLINSAKGTTDRSDIYGQSSEGEGQEDGKTSGEHRRSSRSGETMVNHSAFYDQSLEEEGQDSRKTYDGRSSDPIRANIADTRAGFDSFSKSKVGLIKRQLSDNAVETSTPAVRAVPGEVESSTPKTKTVLNDMPDCEPQGLASPPAIGDEDFTLGGQADSVYEYLPKQYMLLGGHEDKYRVMYENAIEASKKWLLFRPMLPDNRDILLSGSVKTKGELDKPNNLLLQPEGTHLTCFAGGMFAIGAKIFDREPDLDLAKKLTDGCIWAYEATSTGIMPEHYLAVPCKSRSNCSWNETRYEELIDPQWKRRREEQRQRKLQSQQHAPMYELQEQSESVGEKLFSETQERPGIRDAAQRGPEGEAVERSPKGHANLHGEQAPDAGSLVKRQLREIGSELPQKPAARTAESSAKENIPNPEAFSEKHRTEKEKEVRELEEEGSHTKPESQLPLKFAKMADNSMREDPPESEAVDVNNRTEKETEAETDDLTRAERELALKPASKTTETSIGENSPEEEAIFVKDATEDLKKKGTYEGGKADIDDQANSEAVAIDTNNAKAKVPPANASPTTPTAVEYFDGLFKLHPERLPPGMTRISGTQYILRPEAIESIFIMYRVTGDTYWREKGWQMFEAIVKHTAAKYGASAIDDVTSEKPVHTDSMESFWLAETLKYFYLLFSDPDQVINLDNYVLNTEAHPFKRPT